MHCPTTLRRLARKFPLLAAAFSPAALPQEAAQQAPGIEEIIITAQKREQALQDVPIAVSVLDNRALLAAGVETIADVARHVPALEVQSSVGSMSTSLRLRRVGNIGNIPTFEPAVGLFIDGAFRTRSVFASGDLVHLDRIEVLRGPQSTLHGKNTTGGVISVHTQGAPTEFEAGAEITAGRLDGARGASHLQFRGRVGGPLAEGLFGSLGIATTDSGATLDEALVRGGVPANDSGRYTLRGNLQWGSPETVEWRLITGLSREDNRRETPDIYYDPNGLGRTVLPALRTAGVSDTCTDNDPHNRVTCIIEPLTTDLAMREATLLGTHEFANGWSLHSVTSWDEVVYHGTMNDIAQLQAPLLRFHDMQYGTSLQQELRLASAPAATVEWLTGLFVYDSEHRRGDHGRRPAFTGDRFSAHPAISAINQRVLYLPAPLPVAAPGQAGYLDSWQETAYVGAYGQATWNLTDDFSVTAGARWQTEDKEAGVRQWTNDPAPSLLSHLISPAAVSSDALARDTSKATWSLTPQWRPRDGVMFFATAATGFKSGGFNTGFGRLPIAEREFADEEVRHIEAGVKLATSRRWHLAANVFSSRYEDYQEAAFVGAQFTVGNAEEVELDGFEIEGMLLIGERLTADFAVSRADMVYGRHFSAPCFPGRAPDSPLNNGACNLTGGQPVNAPEWKTHAGLQYDAPVAWGALNLRADWSWTDAYNTNFSGDPRLLQDAYHWLNLRAAARRGAYELIAWVENLTDETVVNYDAVLTLYAGDGSYQSMLQEPRSFGVTLRVNY